MKIAVWEIDVGKIDNAFGSHKVFDAGCPNDACGERVLMRRLQDKREEFLREYKVANDMDAPMNLVPLCCIASLRAVHSAAIST